MEEERPNEAVNALGRRWSELQEQESTLSHTEFDRLQQDWYQSAKACLLEVPPDAHCWCQHAQLAVPLLRSFRTFFEEPPDELLHSLWQRMSEEFSQCIACIVDYNRAKMTLDTQTTEGAYMLKVLNTMDDQRIASILAEFARRIRAEAYDESDEDFMLRLSFTLAEVLMFPSVLDDEEVDELIAEVVVFIESNRTLGYNGDSWPGVIALLFHNNPEMRRIALRIASSMPSYSTSADVEGLAPIVGERIKLLEGDPCKPSEDRWQHKELLRRPKRKQQEVALWVGLQTLLNLMEPAAMEALFLEPFPWLVSTIVHRASDLSRPGFKFILNCLKLLLRGLGDRFWAETAFMPANVRSMLVSNCYETREADMHKTIFELFQYFLQSLESRVDSKDYQEQRDLILLQLLERVPGSDNFSSLSKKQAKEAAFRIIRHGYDLRPPTVPIELVNSWGFALLSVVHDVSVHASLRQVAVELASLVLVADASAAAACLLTLQEASKDSTKGMSDLTTQEPLESEPWSSISSSVAESWSTWSSSPFLWQGLLAEPLPHYSTMAVYAPLTKAVMLATAKLALAEGGFQSLPEDKLSFEGKDLKEAVGTMKKLLGDFVVREFKGSPPTCLDSVPFEPWVASSAFLLLLHSSSAVQSSARTEVLKFYSGSSLLDTGLLEMCSQTGSPRAIERAVSSATAMLLSQGFPRLARGAQLLFFYCTKLLNLPVPEETTDWQRSCQVIAKTLWPLAVEVLGKARAVAKPFERLCVSLFDNLLCLWPFTRTRALKPLKVSGVTTPSSWWVDFLLWGQVKEAAIRRRWMSCLETIGLDLREQSRSLPGLLEAARELFVRDSELTDDHKFTIAQLFPTAAPGNLASRPLENLPKRQVIPEASEERIRTSEPPKAVPGSERIRISEKTGDWSWLDEQTGTSEKLSKAFLEGEEETQVVTPKAKHPSGGFFAPRGTERSFAKTRSDPFAFQPFPEQSRVKVPPSNWLFSLDSANEAVSRFEESTKRFAEKTKQVLNVEDDKAAKDVEDDEAPKGGKYKVPVRFARAQKQRSERAKEKENKDKGEERRKNREETEKENEKQQKDVDKEVQEVSKDPKEKAEKTRLFEELGANELDEELSQKAVKRPLQLPRQNLPRRQLKVLSVTPVEGMRRAQILQHRKAQPKGPPRLDEWFKLILALDFFRVTNQKDMDEDSEAEGLQRVPDTFVSAQHYTKVFRPLLLEEFKAQLLKCQEDSLSSGSPDTEQVGPVRLLGLEKRDEFYVARFVAEPDAERKARECSELDLFLVTKQSHKRGHAQGLHFLAKVEKKDVRDQQAGRRAPETVLSLRLYFNPLSTRMTKAKDGLKDGSTWHATRLFSMIPQQRELQALAAIGDLPLVDTILNPRKSPLSKRSCADSLGALPVPLRKRLKSDYNSSQLSAISAAIGSPSLDQHLALVQGPPGTGKTSTIVGIVSALLASVKKPQGGFGQGSRREAMTAWQAAELARSMVEASKREKKPRVLLCAQSNAAVDEIVARIRKSGLYDIDGGAFQPSIVRVGNKQTVHTNSLPVHIDTLVDQRLHGTSRGSGTSSDGTARALKLRSTLNTINDAIQDIRNRLSETSKDPDSGAPQAEEEERLRVALRTHKQKRESVQGELIKLERELRQEQVEERQKERELRRQIVRESTIVVTTLSGCGADIFFSLQDSSLRSSLSPSLRETDSFDAVVIDEAAQALEPATLIPLQLLGGPRLGQARLVMVGDPKQLPATVLSISAAKRNYERSMFERLQKGGLPVTMLSAQYRMHPEIRQFPSNHFYNGQLTDGEGINVIARTAPFHERRCFGPYVFFDVADGKEKTRGGGSSISNIEEASFAVELFRSLQKLYPGESGRGHIGVITTYKSQLYLLKRMFERSFGSAIAADIDFNTVDGFQGREVDILILSTVRAHSARSGSIGFVANVRRMNVMLTRARRSLWIVGNANALQTSSEHWGALVRDARERGVVFRATAPYESFFRGSSEGPQQSDKAQQLRKAEVIQRDKQVDFKGRVISNDKVEVAKDKSRGLSKEGSTAPDRKQSEWQRKALEASKRKWEESVQRETLSTGSRVPLQGSPRPDDTNKLAKRQRISEGHAPGSVRPSSQSKERKQESHATSRAVLDHRLTASGSGIISNRNSNDRRMGRPRSGQAQVQMDPQGTNKAGLMAPKLRKPVPDKRKSRGEVEALLGGGLKSSKPARGIGPGIGVSQARQVSGAHQTLPLESGARSQPPPNKNR